MLQSNLESLTKLALVRRKGSGRGQKPPPPLFFFLMVTALEEIMYKNSVEFSNQAILLIPQGDVGGV